MKLKFIVASMGVLGLISFPALAAHSKNHTTTDVNNQVGYKDGALPVCPINDPYTMMLDSMDQNVGRAKPTEGCDKLISFAGGINFDGHWGNRSMGYMGENNQTFSLNDAYLNIYGNVNDWTKAFASLSYNNVSGESDNNRKLGEYSNVYPDNTLTLEQGFIRFSNFNESPIFFQVGKQFQDFGRYQIHALERTMAQVLSETLATSVEAGFVTAMGFHGDIYAFDNLLNQRTALATTAPANGHPEVVWGAALGFDHPSERLGYNVGIGYMSNMTTVNDVADAITEYNGTDGDVTSTNSYRDGVGAVALYGDINSGPFSAGVRYVTATSSFDAVDLSSIAAPTNGARPWAVDVQAGYNFNAWTKNQNIYVGYQASGDAVNIFLPNNRWIAGYNIDAWKNTNFGLELGHDNDYGTGSGGTGDSSNTIAARAAVMFG